MLYFVQSKLFTINNNKNKIIKVLLVPTRCKKTSIISNQIQVHITITHVTEFLAFTKEYAGLGFYSEQAMESSHHDFKVRKEQ